MNGLKGLATGVGSLPHKDAESALDLIFKYAPQIPFWPQLPKRDVREGMVAQFSENIPCLKINPSGLVFDAQNKDKELEAFYEAVISQNTEYFSISPEYALGLHCFLERLQKVNLENIRFIKGQLTGPFTFAASINDQNGVALLHNPVFSQVISQALAYKALWQVKVLQKFGKKVILFIDEPYLGSFGSAYTPINREDVIKGLAELTQTIKSQDVLLGLHCCGNTDWSLFTEVKNIDLLSFDAFEFLERFVLYADNLKGFLERGGLLCWGIVPTQLFVGEETPDLLIRKLKDGLYALTQKGIKEDLLLDNLLISPSCGLGTFGPEKAEKILRLLSETSASIAKYL